MLADVSRTTTIRASGFSQGPRYAPGPGRSRNGRRRFRRCIRGVDLTPRRRRGFPGHPEGPAATERPTAPAEPASARPDHRERPAGLRRLRDRQRGRGPTPPPARPPRPGQEEPGHRRTGRNVHPTAGRAAPGTERRPPHRGHDWRAGLPGSATHSGIGSPDEGFHGQPVRASRTRAS